jgi:hypothetical protein
LRALFLLLLLANLLFLAWNQWIAVPRAPVASVGAGTPAGSTAIRLREEIAPGATQATAMSGASATGLGAEATCASFGPFEDTAAAEAAAARLQKLGFIARLRSSVDEIRVGLWVRVPNLPTPEDAANALAALQRAGFTDAYVLSDGTPGNTVSLGVFGDRAKAEQVAETIRRAGFAPETSDRLRTMDVVWLDIDRQSNGGLPPLEALQPEAAASLPLEIRACAAEPAADDVGPSASAATPAA